MLRFLIWLFLKIEMTGFEYLPKTGAGIVYYNHIHWLDPVLISAKMPRYTVPLAKIETSRWPVVGALLRWYHVIFITRGAVDREALQATWDVLAKGHICTISPEGTRSHDLRLQRAKEGLAFVAKQAPDAWLIPCAVQGTPAFSWSLKAILASPRCDPPPRSAIQAVMARAARPRRVARDDRRGNGATGAIAPVGDARGLRGRRPAATQVDRVSGSWKPDAGSWKLEASSWNGGAIRA